MTDKKKIKHAIEVLNELEKREGDKPVTMIGDIEGSTYHNLVSLRELLEEPHSTGGKKIIDCFPKIAVYLATVLQSLIVGRKPNYRKVDLTPWAAEMDKIIRIDRRTPEQLEEVIRWCQQDSFWQNNILSPSKLRKQLDRLELQMAKDYHWNSNKLRRTVQTGPSVKDKYLENLEKQDGVEGT